MSPRIRNKTGLWLPAAIALSTSLPAVAAAQEDKKSPPKPAEEAEAKDTQSVEARLVGSRSGEHEAPKTMVPVTVLTEGDISAMATGGFISTAQLRGLGPDRVAVLVNGKRRHQMAQVVVSEQVGKGSSGTDLNSIPAAAIERIEILRDSAAAQYGPNAVAGVINVVLKERTGAEFEISAGNFFENDGNAILGLDRASASVNAGMALGESGFLNLTLDVRDRGETNRAGIAEVPSDISGRAFGGAWWQDGPNCPRGEFTPDMPEPCNKVRRLRVGDEDGQDYRLFYNARYGLSPSVSLYSFGGASHRDGSTGAGLFLGRGNGRVPADLYPDGFLPELTTTVIDLSAVLGAQIELSDNWDLDVSAGWGQNSFDYFVSNSANVSYYFEPLSETDPTIFAETPTEANAGKLTNSELTANVDVTGEIDAIEGLRVGAGAELRIDNYSITRGDKVSYQYARDGEVREQGLGFFNPTAFPLIEQVVGGIQGFPGFGEEVNGSRSAWALYVDAEQQLTDWWLIGAAGRFENVEFTGQAIVGKLATRFDLADFLAIRASASNGSRSPGVQQIYFKQKFTEILPAGLLEVITSGDADQNRKDFGIGALKPEKSLTASGGLVLAPDIGAGNELTFSADAFQIKMTDRILLSESVTGEVPTVPVGQEDTPGRERFRELLLERQLGAAQFFTNPVDTTTRGFDLAAAYHQNFGSYGLGLGGVFNYAETRIDGGEPDSNFVKGPDLFGPIQQVRLEKGDPRYTATIAHVSSYDELAVNISFNYYGEVTGKAFANLDDEKVWSGKWLTDASVSYSPLEELTLTVGGSNIFDVFPDKWGEEGRLHPEVGYTYGLETLPFGQNGGFYYASARYTL